MPLHITPTPDQDRARQPGGSIYDRMKAEADAKPVAALPAALAPIPNPPAHSTVTQEQADLNSLAVGLVVCSGLWTHAYCPGAYYVRRERALAEAYKAFVGKMRT